MAEFVNKVKKNDVEYEIRDARIPEADVADAGKVLKVASEGGYELGEAGGDASNVIAISGDLHIGSGSTMQDIFDANIGIEEPAQFQSVTYDVYFENSITYDPGMSRGAAQLQITTYGSIQVYIRFSYRKSGNDWVEPTINLTDYNTTFANGTFSLERPIRGLPELPSDASEKTYAIENSGTNVVWSEKQSGGGTQLYKHRITCKNTSTGQDRIIVNVISSSATPVTDSTTWFALWNDTVHYDDMYCMKESDSEFHSGFYSGMKGKFIYRVYTDFTTYTDEEYDYDKLTDTVTAL